MDLLITLGDAEAGSAHLATRRSDRWKVGPVAAAAHRGLTTLELPDEPYWRAWVDPSSDVGGGVGRATDARLVTWHDGVSSSTCLPPVDIGDFSRVDRLPEGYSSPGLDFAVRYRLTGAPGGELTAVLVWRDGIATSCSHEVPDDIGPGWTVDIRAPYATVLGYLNRRRSIYAVLSQGSTIVGNPSVIQYMAGYIELGAFIEEDVPGRMLGRQLLLDFLEHPPAGGS